jgi:fructose-1,6-bisphosphatase II / sedoheptulose-1,7-bisphosphatase
MPDAEIDIYLGSGGAPEGVLAAAALRCVGGQMQGRLQYETDEQIQRVRDMGHADPKKCFSAEEMAKGDVMFAATGVTGGAMLRGVRRHLGSAITHSIVMRSHSGTVRFIEGRHNLVTKTWMSP